MTNNQNDPSADQPEGVFDFSDLQALREEYEERIARLEREREAALDVVRRDAENRIASMTREHARQMESEAVARQELIEELTIELANAREEGERRATAAEKQKVVVEQRLELAMRELLRIEGDVQRLKELLTPPPVVETPVAAPQPVATVTMSTGTTPPHGTQAPTTSTPPTQTVDATGLVVQKRRKIRLR